MSRAAHEAARVLRAVFGFSDFRPGQAEVIAAITSGHSALAVFPTGGGKSLCYQVPALLLQGLTLVVSPLIALMKDQVDFLQQRGVDADRLDSSRTSEEVQSIYARMASGSLRLLHIAPERLGNTGFRRHLARTRVDLVAVDEAHCISEWGHNFRPDYLKLAAAVRELKIPRVLALTATATPEVGRDICRAFQIAPRHHIQTGFHRPNLHLVTERCPSEQRLGRLQALVQGQTGATVVYVTLQKTAEEVARALVDAGISAAAYHAGMKPPDRAAVQDDFMADRLRVVVATIAFGMGIDKPDIRAVIHFNLPKSLEGYSQQVGRAGRDGLPARCTLLACADDLVVLHNFTYGDTPTRGALTGFVDALTSSGTEFSVSRHQLSRTHDLRPLVVSTALTYLELTGVLTPTGPFYDTLAWRGLVPLDVLLAPFSGERRSFLEALLEAGKKGRTWQTLSVTATAADLSVSRQRIGAAMQWLVEQKWVETRVSQLRHGYRRPAHVDTAAVVDDLMERFAQREAADIGRTHQLARFAEGRACLTHQLVAHFGEPLDGPCAHCGVCAGQEGGPLPRTHPEALQAKHHALVQRVAGEHPKRLAHPRTLARFLCGLRSPAFQGRGGLARHRDFGTLGHLPFDAVLDAAHATRA